MIQNFDFIKKNNHEIFREQCSILTQNLQKLFVQLQNLRASFYKCAQKTIRPLDESSMDEDIKLILSLENKAQSEKQQYIFEKTIQTLIIYQEDFEHICSSVDKNLQKYVQSINRRNLSVNNKMFENIQKLRGKIELYFYSLQDSDLPCRIKSDIFAY